MIFLRARSTRNNAEVRYRVIFISVPSSFVLMVGNNPIVAHSTLV